MYCICSFEAGCHALPMLKGREFHKGIIMSKQNLVENALAGTSTKAAESSEGIGAGDSCGHENKDRIRISKTRKQIGYRRTIGKKSGAG